MLVHGGANSLLKGLSCHLVMPRGFHIEFYLFIYREERAGLMHETDVESCMDASDTSAGTDSAFGTWRLTACWSDTESAEEEEIRNVCMLSDGEQRDYVSFKKKRKKKRICCSGNSAKCATLPRNVYV